MKRSRLSPERRRFERATLLKLEASGATPRDLARIRWLLTLGRKNGCKDYVAALNVASQEKAGIEFMERALRGEPPDTIIFRLNPLPETKYHG